MTSKKIFINKSDDAVTVVEKVVDAASREVVLHIPRFSALAKSSEAFDALKRESDNAGKTLRVESVDDRAVELARAAGIDAENPFFKNASRPMTDIVTRPLSRRVKPRVTLVVAPADETPEAAGDEPAAEDPRAALVVRETQVAEELDERFGPLEPERPKRRGWYLKALMTVVACSSAAAFLGLKVLPRADIQIVTAKEDWKYADAVVADKTVASPVSDPVKVPGQLFTEKRNVTLAFPATGKRNVAVKASGNISIINAYSSEAQKLVASTRFETPDGKTFRIIKAVTVPGAKIIDGKIIPSSIEATVTADKAGAEYNISDGTTFTIPGFKKGTPKYNAFSGEAKSAMSGGFLGVRAYPADEDVKKAKDAIAATLTEGLQAAVGAKVPQGFKVLEGSNQFRVVKQSVDTAVNEAGAFSVTAEAEMSVMGIRETDVLRALHNRLTGDKKEYEIRSETLSYGAARFDAAAGRMTFPVDFTSVIARKVDVDELRGKARAKPERDLKAMLLTVPGLESARVALWPFWVRSVPDDVAKVAISVE